MRFRKLLFVILLIIVGMFGLMLTTSYAWYSYSGGSTTFDVETANDDLEINFVSSRYINTTTAIPVKGDAIKKYSDKNNFTIDVISDNVNDQVAVTVSLIDVEIDSALRNNKFKVELYHQGAMVGSTKTGNNFTTGTDIVFNSVLLDRTLTNYFELRIYIADDNTDQSAMMDKRFSATIEINSGYRLGTNNGDIYISTITVDGKVTNSIPTTGTYTMSSSCTKGSTLSWDTVTKTVTYESGSKVEDNCNLTFTSSTDYVYLNEMPVGSYVKYVGKGGTVGSTAVACQTNGPSSSSTETDATEAPNSCLGQNAREDIDINENTHGYCYSDGYRYYVTGWRLAYVDSNNKPVIISAGSPECNSRIESTANVTYIETANALALKYCNTEYVDGNCTCTSSTSGQCSSPSTDAWAINDNDFNMITKAITGTTTGGYLVTEIAGATNCDNENAAKACGYGNDLIDNGGYYWFAEGIPDTSEGVWFDADYKDFRIYSDIDAYGLRPVISLKSSVYVVGGTGTIDDPYEIMVVS